MPNCNQDSWILEEVIEEDEDSTYAIVRIAQNGSYRPEQKWPAVGQMLVVKEAEQ